MGLTGPWTQPSQAGSQPAATPLLLARGEQDLFNPQEAGRNIYGTT